MRVGVCDFPYDTMASRKSQEEVAGPCKWRKQAEPPRTREVETARRILAAMAQDGQLPALLAKTNAREAPIPSLVVQAIFTIIFVWAASSHGNADNVLVLIGMPT